MLMFSVVKDFDTEELIPYNDLKYPAIDAWTDLECKYMCWL